MIRCGEVSDVNRERRGLKRGCPRKGLRSFSFSKNEQTEDGTYRRRKECGIGPGFPGILCGKSILAVEVLILKLEL